MKRFFFITYSLLALMVFSASSCGSSVTEDPIPDPTPPSPPAPAPKPSDYYSEFAIPAKEEDGVARAFPGASGGGAVTTGGRGGRVLHVTSLDDSSVAGTLRWAVNQSGARTVVFDVAGTIALKSRLEIKNGDITIAGQTAPGDGICIRDNNVRIKTDNVIIRFVRFRMGDKTATEDDVLNCYASGTSTYKNIIIDHCSLSWSTDECGTFYGVSNFTLQYCIISESLRNSMHDKGKHGYGGIWGGKDASFHHNLLAHHDSRNPRFDHEYLSTLKGPVHFYNNVIYNWGDNSAYGGESGSGKEPRQINIVSNYYKPGPATKKHKSRIVNPTTSCKNCNPSVPANVTPGKFFVESNYVSGSSSVTADNWAGVEPDDSALKSSIKSTQYQGTKPDMDTAEGAFSKVLALSGASLRRDAVDTRVIAETKEGKYTFTGGNGSTGGLIDSQEDVGGWPQYSATTEELSKVQDSDGDGMPDWFEEKFALKKNDASDGKSKDIDKQGRYTNLEMYMHYLVRNIVSAQ